MTGGRIAGLDRFQPTARAEAPAVAGAQSRKIKFEAGCDQVVAGSEIGREKRVGDFNAYRMTSVVLSARVAVSVPEEARERLH